ncbi:MAG: biopolymer transport protein ExbD [Flavobacteriales bacterium]|jgi:biopolymer transport protein ExbD
MKFRREVKAEESINLTPLIDVVFLLLIFFMVSTTFTKETHLTIDLPESSTEDQQPVVKMQIEVVVDGQGGYSVNGMALVNEQKETLEVAIDKFASGERDIPFIITGDANTTYQAIVNVMDIAGKMGFVNLSMTTRSAEAAAP